MSYGYFSNNELEYIIDRPFDPPRAQLNFLWNDRLISGLNQFGTGEGVFNGRVMLYNDPQGRVLLNQNGARYIYIKDRKSGDTWNIGNYPIKRSVKHQNCHIGLGYSLFKLEYGGIHSRAKAFIDPKEPVEIWEIEFTNQDAKERSLTVAPYVEWYLGGYIMESDRYSYLISKFDETSHSVVSLNTSDEIPHSRYSAFIATDADVEGWCGSRREFMGAYGTSTNPAALESGKFASRIACCEDLAGALNICVTMQPGETRKVCVVMGSCDSIKEARRLSLKVAHDAEYRERIFNEIVQEKLSLFKTSCVETPDKRINLLTNIWTKQQAQLCVEFGRDGIRGFRDTLQDAWAIAPFNRMLAREKIIETLRHQYQRGHTVRGWLPLRLNHYSDGPVWIPMALCGYLKATGDFSLLNVDVPFFDEGSATVLDHMLQGLRHLSEDVGEHGLVLAHNGDWNDSLNWMGRNGKGESVWTSIGLFHGYDLLEELNHAILKEESLTRECREAKEVIREAIEKWGWDGEWYLAGYSDAGIPVGSHKNSEGKCYLNPQTWAIMAGIARGERREKCLNAIDSMLESENGSLTLWPAYTKKDNNVGRITVMLPGMYENGTPYCHATTFKIVADCVVGRGDHAYRTYKKIQPDTESNPSSISGCEPYAFTNQFLGPDNPRKGESISGWLTGTPGWAHRIVTEHICGVQPGYHGIVLDPCLPGHWNEATVKRTIRGIYYHVEIKQSEPGKYQFFINGREVKESFFPYDQVSKGGKASF